MAHITPDEQYVVTDQLASFRANRVPTAFKGCTQLTQLFIKADGKCSCSCMRYRDILADANTQNMATFFHGETMQYIRESFSEGYEPFSFCEGCVSRLMEFEQPIKYDAVDLHIEPSNQCNLFCQACTCTVERRSNNPPPRLQLEYGVFDRLLNDFIAAGIPVRSIALVGFGEPLFNSRTPDMARLGRRLFPAARIIVDTNGNFGLKRAEELADCGLDEIRLALDGVDQKSYVAYRERGDFARAFEFSRKLVQAINEKGSHTRAVWKYILFDHNDSDAQLRKAVALAADIGLPIIFDATVGHNASKRSPDAIQAVTGLPIGCNIDPRSAQASDASSTSDIVLNRTSLWRRMLSLKSSLRRSI